MMRALFARGRYLAADTGDGSPQTESVGLVMTMLHKSLVQADAVGSGGARIIMLPAWPAGVDARFKLSLLLGTVVEGTVVGSNVSVAVLPAARAGDVVYLAPQPVTWR